MHQSKAIRKFGNHTFFLRAFVATKIRPLRRIRTVSFQQLGVYQRIISAIHHYTKDSPIPHDCLKLYSAFSYLHLQKWSLRPGKGVRVSRGRANASATIQRRELHRRCVGSGRSIGTTVFFATFLAGLWCKINGAFFHSLLLGQVERMAVAQPTAVHRSPLDSPLSVTLRVPST